MNTPGRDTLNEGEQRLARAVAGLPAGSPSPQLDAGIQAQAEAAAAGDPHRPAGTVPRPGSRSRGRGWRVPLAAAASMILGVGIVWQLAIAPAPLTPVAGDGRAAEPAASAPSAPAEVVYERPSADAAPARRAATPDMAHGLADDAGGPVSARQVAPDPVQEYGYPMPAPAAGTAPQAAAAPATPPVQAMEREPVASSRFQSGVERTQELAPPMLETVVAPVLPAGDRPPSLEAAVREVRRLLAAGQVRAADVALAELLENHPQALLPPDLAARRERLEPGSGD